jgi:hypothetical protein
VNKIPVSIVSYVPNPNWSDLYRSSIVRSKQSGSLWCVGHVTGIQEVRKNFSGEIVIERKQLARQAMRGCHCDG